MILYEAIIVPRMNEYLAAKEAEKRSREQQRR